MGFREIKLSDKTKILLGRNAENNDELMKKFKGKENTILHTESPGSPFCVIDELKPTKIQIAASGAICVAYSQDWRDNKRDAIVNVFTGKDAKKRFWMKKGTWKVGNSRKMKIKKKDVLAFERKRKK